MPQKFFLTHTNRLINLAHLIEIYPVRAEPRWAIKATNIRGDEIVLLDSEDYLWDDELDADRIDDNFDIVSFYRDRDQDDSGREHDILEACMDAFAELLDDTENEYSVISWSLLALSAENILRKVCGLAIRDEA